ncbi:MAG TPA: hypothetical protein VFW92_10140 [Candidatus Limnocylindrales bacterium]|nr:hypothetical protein [Candidatus Limnocylindrales bacterium]
MRHAIAIIVATFVAVACSGVGGPTNGDIPSRAEAEGFLDRLVTTAQAGQWDAFCGMGDGYCEARLTQIGRSSVPMASPIIIDDSIIPTSPVDGGRSIGGRRLTVCGLDGSGHAYRSDVLVFRDGSSLRAINPVYWDGTSVSSGTDPTTQPRDASPRPPACEP